MIGLKILKKIADVFGFSIDYLIDDNVPRSGNTKIDDPGGS